MSGQTVLPSASIEKAAALKGWRGQTGTAILFCGAVLMAATILAGRYSNEYYLLAAYTILQYVVLGTAWNILGGYGGYFNFGTAAFFAVGAYTTIVLNKLFAPPLVVDMLVGGVIAGLAGVGTGYLTLRLRGFYFGITTLALAIVLETVAVNWSFVGGAHGAYVIRPTAAGIFSSYTQLLLTIMIGLAALAIFAAWAVEKSWIGVGLTAIREDETAAETSGVPSLRLKVLAAALSGALMGMAGGPYPYFVTYVDPSSAFSLVISVNAVAMPLIGGITAWWGPLVGAILLGSAQQILTVTISSAANLLIVGALLVAFVTAAPQGVAGLFRSGKRGRL